MGEPVSATAATAAAAPTVAALAMKFAPSIIEMLGYTGLGWLQGRAQDRAAKQQMQLGREQIASQEKMGLLNLASQTEGQRYNKQQTLYNRSRRGSLVLNALSGTLLMKPIGAPQAPTARGIAQLAQKAGG